MKQLKCIKLTSGEMLIGAVDSEDSDFLLLVDPCEIKHGYNKEGTYGLTIVEFMIDFIEDDSITIASKHIMIESTPTTNLAEFYMEYIEKNRTSKQHRIEARGQLH